MKEERSFKNVHQSKIIPAIYQSKRIKTRYKE